MARAPRRTRTFLPLPLIAGVLTLSGCRLAPRAEVEDCRRLSQTLRSENAQLKDRMLALQAQNRDLSERAVDDSRRLAALEEVNSQLGTSLQVYQDERRKLESAYKDLRASLSNVPLPLSLRIREEDNSEERIAVQSPDRDANPGREQDAELRKTEGTEDEPRARPRGAWSPSRQGGSDPPTDSGNP